MPRPLRIDEPGSIHHVTNRGRNKQSVYVDDADHERFDELLGLKAVECSVDVIAAVHMSNHYHLVVRSNEGRLSELMQYVGGRYTSEFNLRHGADGSLCKGRFYSRLVDTDGYLIEVFRYAVNNPVKAGLVERAEQYRWSTYPSTLGIALKPAYLKSDAFVDEYFNGDLERLDAFVRRADTPRGELLGHVMDGQDTHHRISDAIESIRVRMTRLEAMPLRSDQLRLVVEALQKFVRDSYGVSVYALVDPRSELGSQPIVLLIALLRHYDVAKPADLADAFGISEHHQRRLIKGLHVRADEDPALYKLIADGKALLAEAA